MQPDPDPDPPKRTYSISDRPERPPVPTVRPSAPAKVPAPAPTEARTASLPTEVQAAPPTPPPTRPAPTPPPPVAAPPVNDLDDLLRQIGDSSVADNPGIGAKLTDPQEAERPKGLGPVAIESSGAINFNPEFASFGARFAGFIIDSAVTVAAIAPGFVVLTLSPGTFRFSGILIAITALLLVARWYGSAVSTSGQWIGNRVTHTKVVDVSSGNLLDRSRATSRFLVRALISSVFLLGFVLAFTNSQRRSFHDQFAGSIVTRPARSSWSVGDDPPIDNANDSKPAQ